MSPGKAKNKRKRNSPDIKSSKAQKPSSTPTKAMSHRPVPTTMGDNIDPRQVEFNEVNDLINLDTMKNCRSNTFLGRIIANGGNLPPAYKPNDALILRASTGEAIEGADHDFRATDEYTKLRNAVTVAARSVPEPVKSCVEELLSLVDGMFKIVDHKLNHAINEIKADSQAAKVASKKLDIDRKIEARRQVNKIRLMESELRLTLNHVPVELKDGKVDGNKLMDSVKSFAPSISPYLSSNISVEPLRLKPKDPGSNTIPILLTAPNKATRNALRKQLRDNRERKYQVSNHYPADLYKLIVDIRTQFQSKYNEDQILVSLSNAGNSINILRRPDSNQQWTLQANTQIIPLTGKDLHELNIDQDPHLFKDFTVKKIIPNAASLN